MFNHNRFRNLIIATGALLINLSSYNYADSLDNEFDPVLTNGSLMVFQAGKVIDQSNVSQYRQWLDGSIADLVTSKALTITLGRPLVIPVHPNYRRATSNNSDRTTIGTEPGQLLGYAGGRPFLDLDLNDPLAGIKAAWNMRYSYAPDEVETEKFHWQYRDMKKDSIERRLKMYGAILRYKYRHTNEPIPELENNPYNLYTALYLQVKAPQDIRNTQLLIHRNEVDSATEQAWMYMSSQRRVRRLATGQKTDAFLGSDIMIEDFLGYNGRIMDMQWSYLGSDELLVPIYGHSELTDWQQPADQSGHQLIEFAGHGHCFPKVTWQLRKVHHVEATPNDPSHPLSKRHYIIDAATFAPLLGRIYDNAGQLWKLSLIAASSSELYSEETLSWQGLITEAVSMVDLQAQHCTTLQLKSRQATAPLRNRSFTTQNMRSQGR
jgi:hypothetical protein